MFSVGSPDGPFWKGYRCKLSDKYYRRIKTIGGKALLVHRMVGFTYCYNPLPEVFIICDHINGDTEDNNDTNIRWVTATQCSEQFSAECLPGSEEAGDRKRQDDLGKEQDSTLAE